MIAEARLDEESIFAGIKRFAEEQEQRLACQRENASGFGLTNIKRKTT